MEDEDYEKGGARLAALFTAQGSGNSGAQTLQYQAPKQPKTSQGKTTPSILVAVPVQAFKYDASNNAVPAGKLGAAILGSQATSFFQFLLYQSKQQYSCQINIRPDFSFSVQANLYASFRDEQQQNWSIRFDDSSSLQKFVTFVAIAKSFSSNPPCLIAQDSDVVPSGRAVVTGDSVGIKYTGYLEEGGKPGKVFDTNQNKDKPFRVTLGEGKVVRGWEEGIVGMKKGGKRVLVIPPELAYGARGSPPTIPAKRYSFV
eukprot:TRINITY_DN7875_c0_g1_i1.p2 TRINITY_DN7875_c0_g1~~TRINITY_DN7875_c0_g1_i1.p2  ORF type:complete len:269 (-),score=57.28 TRINITY_DN7875_c0_g1_i1:1015-1788(-)